MKKLMIMFLLLVSSWFLFVSVGKDKLSLWTVFLTEEDGTVHKCKRENYLELKERLIDNEKDERMDMNIYYCWEKDFQNAMMYTPKRKIDYGQLKKIKENAK